MLRPDFTTYIDPSDRSRVIVVGDSARANRPEGTDEQDAGGFRPHFLMWAREDWMHRNPGHELTIVLTFQRLDSPGLEKDLKAQGRIGAIQWPAMSSRRLITADVIIDGESQPWGSIWDVLDLKFVPGQKGFKRLNEITRPSRIWTDNTARILTVSDCDDERYAEEMLYDGAVIMRRSWAIDSVHNVMDPHERAVLRQRLRRGEINRGDTFRMMTYYGLIKGHVIIVDDELIDARWDDKPDIICHETNIKTELEFTKSDAFFCTWEPLKATGSVGHDFQTKSWMKNFLDTPAVQQATQEAILGETEQAIIDGEIPSWALFQPDFYLRSRKRFDPWGEERDPHGSEVMARNWLRCGAAGLDIRCSATIVSLMARGVVNHLTSRLKPVQPTRDDPTPEPNRETQPWMPTPWSCYGYVVSRSLLEDLGGLSFDYPTDTIFWDEGTSSLVVPDSWYVANYENHGGFDQDDRFPMALRWHPEWKQLVLVMWRQPNTKGEWSMTADFAAYSFPWTNTQVDIPELDLDFLPPQKQVTVPGVQALPGHIEPKLPESKWNWGKEYSPEDATEAIEVAFLALASGGVGGYMNVLMVANDMNVDVEIHATPEQVVDVCQATPYREFFEWHAAQVTEMWKQVAEADARLDYLLWATKVPPRLRNQFQTRNGHLTQGYRSAVNLLRKFQASTRNLGFQLRNRHHLEIVNHVTFSDREKEIATKAMAWFEAEMKRIARMNEAGRHVDEGESPYRQASGTLALKMLNTFTNPETEMVDRDALYSAMLCIYNEVIQPRGTHRPYGSPDNLLFSPPPENRTGMLDLMLEALVYFGEAREVELLRFGFYSEARLYDRLDMSEGLPEAQDGEQYMLLLGGADERMIQAIFRTWAEADSERDGFEAIRLLALASAYDEKEG